MVVSVGEILYDLFPEYKRIGGAPFNFAFHLHRFGISAALVSRVGDDENGRDILGFLETQGMETAWIQTDTTRPTGYVSVAMKPDGGHDFHIAPDVAYDRIALTAGMENLPREVELIYFGSLIRRTPEAAATLATMLEKTNPAAIRFCDINLRPGCFTAESIERSLAACTILKLNEEELTVTANLFALQGDDDDIIRRLMERFAIHRVCLTLGKNGSILFTPTDRFPSGPVNDHPVQGDAVGAGDAYAAVLALGFLKEWAPSLIVARASSFARGICDIRGAIPEDDDFYEPFRGWLREIDA